MCHYCHVLKHNPTAPPHPGVRCLDRANIYSQVPLAERIYNKGQSIFPIPSAPPAEEEFGNRPKLKQKKLINRFLKLFTK
ncbi:unnamed protein product [Adineta steineri]|uniref:Uncharacterized protein n=1 Tax=Adineta steineri TaxID=433720 RepID=A0A815NEG7_9BILA|nr:unnamed protein product [Adineta steineri]CAF3980560.1 unnamed protein product [Adineta steineri]